MKVVRLGALGEHVVLRLLDEERPTPEAGEVLVRIRACSLNYRDAFVMQGKIPFDDGRVPLSDGAGEVVEIGEGVNSLVVGDAVVSVFYPYWTNGEMGPGTKRDIPGESFDGFAREWVCLPAEAFTRAPAGYSHVEAATLTCTAVTAWRGLVVCGQVRPGDTVLTLGTGSVSLFALQIAKAAGARVIATSSSEEKLDTLRRLGADEVINYRAVADWGQAVRDITDGRGVDHVIEVGGPATLSQSIAACGTGGHIALIGVLTGFDASVSIPALFSNQIRVTGVSIGSRKDQEDLIRAINVTGIRPVVDRSFQLSEIAEAFQYFEAGQHVGKVCLVAERP